MRQPAKGAVCRAEKGEVMSDFRYDTMSPSSVYPEVRVTHLPSGESRIFDQHKSPFKNLLDARRWANEKSGISEYSKPDERKLAFKCNGISYWSDGTASQDAPVINEYMGKIEQSSTRLSGDRKTV